MTAPEEPAPSDQELADALVEGVGGDHAPGEFTADDFAESGEPRVMTGGARVGEVNAGDDVVFRDKISHNYFGGGPTARGREPAPLSLARDTLEDVREAFVPPPGFADLDLGERLLIVRICSGRGGGTAATRLLLDAGAGAVKELAPDTSLRRLTAERLEDGTGYLLRNATSGVLDELTEFEIARLRAALGDRSGWLVLTVDPRVRLAEGVLSRYIGELGDPPPALEVLTAHLRRHLRQQDPDGTRAAEILADPSVVTLLDDSADREDRVARAASFARILADAAKADDFDLAKIQAQLKRLTDRSFEAWFDALDAGTRCFVIALATLPGYSYEIVSDAAGDLAAELIPPVPPAPGAPAPDPFRVRRTQRLEAALARVSQRPVTTRYGTTPMEVVRFIDPSLSRQVLNRVWTEYADIRETLLKWLRAMAQHPVGEVRYGAARAAGVFAVQAFDYVRRYVINPWAASDVPMSRQAAALSLEVPGRDPSVSQATRRMLYDWHLDTSDAYLRNTAARTYGGLLGLIDPGPALDAFAHLATAADRGLPTVVANSVTRLVVRGDESVALQVVRRLRTWTAGAAVDPPEGSRRATRGMTAQQEKDDIRARTFVAYLSFLTCAVDAVLVNPVDEREDAAAWHGLLWLAHRNDAIAAVVADLWGGALVHPIAHQAAHNVLTVWAERVDGDPVGRRALADLLVAAVRAPDRSRARVTLRRLVRTWQDSREAVAPRTAATVSTALTALGEAA
ncbi:hypothetical protein AB0J80_06230 [Actinoplanes sp. NPDC049548]|uniref:hypothetical protein n=1 Tax=Actinoplanes sp. NPDC049548 TaxID=3155152 RepID=UPI003447B752